MILFPLNDVWWGSGEVWSMGGGFFVQRNKGVVEYGVYVPIFW